MIDIEDELREQIRKLYGVKKSHYINFEPRLEQLMLLIATYTEQTKKRMAMCVDDKTFLEEHKHANVLEYDEALKRPSKAIYFNRQWGAEKQGLDTLALFGKMLQEAKDE